MYYTLTKANAGYAPDFSTRTTIRGFKAEWIPHVDETDRDWVSLYVDPREVADTFEAGDPVAIVLFTAGDPPATGYLVGHVGPGGAGSGAWSFNTNGELEPMGTSYAGFHLSVRFGYRLWHATKTDRSTHDDWVTFQNWRVGQVFKDVNERAFGKNGAPVMADGDPSSPNVEIWPFTHTPGRRKHGVRSREWYGTDITEDRNNDGTATHLGRLQMGFVNNMKWLGSAYGGRVMPTSYQVTDERIDPTQDPRKIHEASKWAFAAGGMGVFYLKYPPDEEPGYTSWKNREMPKVRAFTAPKRLFPEHYRWVNEGHLPDTTLANDIYSMSLPCPIFEDGKAGHVLVANDELYRGGQSNTPATVDLQDHIPAPWKTVQDEGPFAVDVATIYHQQPFDGSHVVPPHDERILCVPDQALTYTLNRRGDPALESVLVARYHTPAEQPGDIDPAKPSGSYCTDHEMKVRWTPAPQECLDQRDYVGSRVSIAFEVFTATAGDPVEKWRHLYAPVSDAPDNGEVIIDICGPYPPSTTWCPIEHYGKPWRARLTLYGSVVIGVPRGAPLSTSYSSTFTVLPEYGGACHRAGGCPYVGAATDEGHVMDNNVLAYSGDGTPVVDHYRLRIQPALLDSLYHLTLSETAQDVSVVDSVSVLLVDHPESTRVAVAHDGTTYGFTDLRPPVSALAADGSDVVALLAAEDDTLNYHGFAGDQVTLDLGEADSTSALYVVSDIKLVPVPGPLSVLVQVPDPATEWTTVTRIEPRDLWGEDVLPLSALGYAAGDSVRIRLLWTAEHKVDAVGLLSGTAVWTAVNVPLG